MNIDKNSKNNNQSKIRNQDKIKEQNENKEIDKAKSSNKKILSYFNTASSYSKRITAFIFLIATMLFTGALILELYTKNFSRLLLDKPVKLVILALITTLPIYSINIFFLTTLNAFKKTLLSKKELKNPKISLSKNIFSGSLFSLTLILILLNYDFFSYKILFNDKTLTVTDFIRHIVALEATIFLGMFYEKIRKKQFIYGLVIILTILIYFTIRYVINT
ncbi:hypothetical protein [Orenia marismortui]|uniref:Uncharacterized protein n=1 Tax=Orenia marismortui TaxID=46469 RepID=A0A4R8GZG5_9FIRM|nr:hypothetical protein [Orenia marismortui]TDX51953.1 hypothetical protein C7959_10977 [Orenia marismortui]